MKTILSLAVTLVALVVLAGCGSGSIAGKWTGKPDKAKALEGVPADQRAMAEKTLENMSIELDLKPDKKFALQILGLPFASDKPIEGTWEQTEKVVKLTPTDTKQPAFDANVSEDGKSITLNQPGGGGMSIVLTKSAS